MTGKKERNEMYDRGNRSPRAYLGEVLHSDSAAEDCTGRVNNVQ